jgi:hypothetical protein
MIHDATVEVTCDGYKCQASEFVELRAGAGNSYLASDSEIEKELERHDWVVKDGKHFCCDGCAKK